MPTARRLAVAAADFRVGVDLLGVINGLNQTFTAPEAFVRQVPGLTIAVLYNGHRLREGGANDYTLSESGGPGTGYDTVQLLFTPLSGDTLTADYTVD